MVWAAPVGQTGPGEASPDLAGSVELTRAGFETFEADVLTDAALLLDFCPRVTEWIRLSSYSPAMCGDAGC